MTIISNQYTAVDIAPGGVDIPVDFMEREDVYWNKLLIKESGGNPELFGEIVVREYLAEQMRVDYNLVSNSVSDPLYSQLAEQAKFVEALKSALGIDEPAPELAKLEREAYEDPAKYLTNP